MDGVGLNAARNTMGMPFVIPPRMPPQWFVSVMILPFSTVKASLSSLPRRLATPKPTPNSMPLTAGMENAAWASRLSTHAPRWGAALWTGITTVRLGSGWDIGYWF